MIDNVVVPVASGYGVKEEYKYLKSSIQEYLTGWFVLINSKGHHSILIFSGGAYYFLLDSQILTHKLSGESIGVLGINQSFWIN